MGTAVSILIIAGVAALGIYGLRHIVRVSTGKDGCCGGSTGTAEPKHTRRPAATTVADTDPSHYPHTATLTVRGMSCEACVRRVENGLNALPGTWATVDLATRTATVRTKEPVERERLEEAVEQAGYSVIRL